MCFRTLVLLSLVSLSFRGHSCSEDNKLNTITLNCNFQYFSNDPYGCEAVKLTVLSRRTMIKNIYPSPKAHVAVFYAFNPNIIFIPKKIGDHFPYLQKLVITKSGLKYIEWRDFKNMKLLKTLHLNENKIERISECAFHYLENLENINLEGNLIVSLHEKHFFNLPNLSTVSFDGNNITELDSDLFQNNSKLKEMRFRDNKINAIRINFRQLRMLKFVDLRSNDCISISFTCCEFFSEFIGNITQKCEGPGLCNK